MSDFAMIRVAVAADVEPRTRPVLDRYEQQLTAQQRTVAALRYLSPAILMQDALNDMAQSGLARHRHFLAQVTDYHTAWREHVVPMIFRKVRLANFADLPAFAYVEEPAARSPAGWPCPPLPFVRDAGFIDDEPARAAPRPVYPSALTGVGPFSTASLGRRRVSAGGLGTRHLLSFRGCVGCSPPVLRGRAGASSAPSAWGPSVGGHFGAVRGCVR